VRAFPETARRGRSGTVRAVGLVAKLVAPLSRRDVYPARSTRIPVADTDLELPMADGVLLRGWEVNPGRDRALVYFGGNAEGLDWLVPELARRFPDHTSYLLAYRGYGASQGQPSQRAITRDGLAVLDHAAARHPRADSVDVIGRSLGSGVAVQVAVRRHVERLVLVTPFDSIVGVAGDRLPPWLPARRLLADPWDSAAVAAQLRSHILVVRAGADSVVRPARTDALLDALPGDAEVLDLPGAGHSTLHEDAAYWPAIADFLAR
jgi:fermentation-respiration switch protein FrsA (DUF1100 family)